MHEQDTQGSEERPVSPLKAVRIDEGRLLVPRREASADWHDWPGMDVAEAGTPEYDRWANRVYEDARYDRWGNRVYEGERLPMFVRWAIDDVIWDWPGWGRSWNRKSWSLAPKGEGR